MGHRDALLDGAKRCLYERGYAHTPARDIVAASGTNLASIGYHFGSKEALLNAALADAIEEWGDRLQESIRATRPRARDPYARCERAWTQIIDSFEAHRPLWLSLIEALAQVERSPEVRALLGEALARGRERIAAAFGGDGTNASATRTRTTGAFFQALLLGVVTQWLVDPARAPSGRTMAAALRTLNATLQPEG
jgi:AcrR family transcriptional regulator